MAGSNIYLKALKKSQWSTRIDGSQLFLDCGGPSVRMLLQKLKIERLVRMLPPALKEAQQIPE